MPVTGDELRTAMRRFPAGVAVLTLVAEGRPLGVTVGSLVSISLTPPLVLVAIGVDSAVHAQLHESGRFVANLLAGDQAPLAQHFSRSVPPIAQWDGIAVRADPGDAPRLEGAIAWLDCRVVAEHAAGDHTLVVGEVESFELGRSGPGLVYVGGGYRAA